MRGRLITGAISRRAWLVAPVLAGAALLTAVGAFRYYPAYRQAVEARDELRAGEEVLRKRVIRYKS